MGRSRSASHTVTRQQYYRGKRVVTPDALPQVSFDSRAALENADYPRIDPEQAIERAMQLLPP